MMLRTTRYGNGYQCGCCYWSHEDSDWIANSTAEQFLDDCIDIIEQGRYGEAVSRHLGLERLDYEQDGEALWSCIVQGGEWTLERSGGQQYCLFHYSELLREPKILQPVDRGDALAWLQEDMD